jgi:ATP-dependent helicase HrpA
LQADIRAQRDALVYPGFLAATPWTHATQIPRYLAASTRRIAKFAERAARDAQHAEQVAHWWRRYQERHAAVHKSGAEDAALEAFRWLLEELRVSLFAQELKTPYPVSFKRVEKAWAGLSGG